MTFPFLYVLVYIYSGGYLPVFCLQNRLKFVNVITHVVSNRLKSSIMSNNKSELFNKRFMINIHSDRDFYCTIIEINISYKISIKSIKSIKMKIVIILRTILQFSEHFQLIFNNSNVNNDKQMKQKISIFFSVKFSELSNFS